MLCSSARRSELKLTCKIRAAWAGLSGVRQERFQASCHVPEVLSSVFEVLVRIPGVLGVPGCCCLLYYGGFKLLSDIIMVEIKFRVKQVIFMRKSVVEVWYTIRN